MLAFLWKATDAHAQRPGPKNSRISPKRMPIFLHESLSVYGREAMTKNQVIRWPLYDFE
jgi:hypothetical protein